MVAYNFQKRFVPRIQDGTKLQTIRRIGKRPHARPGSQLQLYTGQRTKYCQKIIDDPTCLEVKPVTIYVRKDHMAVFVEGKPIKRLDEFAVADGFADFEDFHKFWLEFHGEGEAVDHLLIKWG